MPRFQIIIRTVMTRECSKVLFQDTQSVAVDAGSGVVNRKAAWVCPRSATERSAIIINRFFDCEIASAPLDTPHHGQPSTAYC